MYRANVNGLDVSDNDCMNPPDIFRPYDFRRDFIAYKQHVKPAFVKLMAKSPNEAHETKRVLHGKRLACEGAGCSDTADCMDRGCRECTQKDMYRNKLACVGVLPGGVIFEEPRACAFGIALNGCFHAPSMM